MKKVLVTGGNGQLGNECRLSQPHSIDATYLDIPELDITCAEQVRQAVSEAKPEIILHLAAWTDVDGAETQPESAFRVNKEGTQTLCEEAQSVGARFIYVSTDYVFPSNTHQESWGIGDKPKPFNVYGASKLAGEQVVGQILKTNSHIVRTSWLYGRSGKNFPKTMAELMLQGKDLRVIDDQTGCPTWAGGLAKALWALTQAHKSPHLLHYSDGPSATWFEFAQAVRGYLVQAEPKLAGTLSPCPTSEYPTPAQRPDWSVLEYSNFWADCGLPQSDWRHNLLVWLPTILDFPKSTIEPGLL